MTVGVIDIGSNTIKSLAATRSPAGNLVTLSAGAVDARISAGLNEASPRLSPGAMRTGLEAVRQLLAALEAFRPDCVALVATSAVRGAANGPEFAALVSAATGHGLRILSGMEEADLIGRGLLSDPALSGLRDFHVFDLGGGSLECLTFVDRRPIQMVSLPLGCVRLTERWVSDSRAPFGDASRTAVVEACRTAFAEQAFHFHRDAAYPAVFTGGTMTTARTMLAARRGVGLEAADSVIPVAQLQALLDEAASRSLEERRKIPGLPPARADVYPAALVTAITLADLGGFTAFHHSLHNLRYGVAAELLDR